MDESGLKSRGCVGTFWLARSVEGGDLLGSVYVNASEGDGSAVIGHSQTVEYTFVPVDGRVGSFELLIVSHSARNRGVGSALLLYAEAELAYLGCADFKVSRQVLSILFG
jgi:GNAT superfamily N-acetyltransferase